MRALALGLTLLTGSVRPLTSGRGAISGRWRSRIC